MRINSQIRRNDKVLGGWWKCLLMFITLVAVDEAMAVTAVWIGPSTGGDFQQGSNWTTNPNPPKANDFAIINSVNGTITFSSSTPVLSNTFFTGQDLLTTLDIGAGKTHSTSSLFLVGSQLPNQDVTVSSGTLNVGTILFIGSEVGSDNTDVIITGANTVVHTSNQGIN